MAHQNIKRIETIIKELQENKVFDVIPGRKHASFTKPVSLMNDPFVFQPRKFSPSKVLLYTVYLW